MEYSMKIKTSLLLVLLLFSLIQGDQRFIVGTPESIIFDMVNSNLKPSLEYAFNISEREDINVIIEDFHYSVDYIAMHGNICHIKNSAFIFKGDNEEVYGWIVNLDENRAFEYTTNDYGFVVVEQVPVEKVYSIENSEVLPEFKFENEPVPEVPFVAGPPFPPHIGKYPGSNLNKLQSLPGAKKVIYLNISDMMNGDTPNPPSTKEDIWKTWQGVSNQYSAFQVNITTDPDVYKAAGVRNAGICNYIDAVGRSSCGINIFGTSSACKCYRDRGDGRPTGGMWLGIRSGHETGHMMGVGDYGGNPGGNYFEGFPRYKWVPIMGNFWMTIPWKDKALIQWSKGEYNTANTKKDYLAIVNKKIPYRKDDIPQTRPLEIINGTQIAIKDNFGQICPNTDSDEFTFEVKTTKGRINFFIDRIEALWSTMLDVDASILDESGRVLAHHNADSARFASFDMDLKQGKYTLLIKGGAEGTPQIGFSNYGSLGFYGIEGSIEGATNIANFTYVKNSINLYYVKHLSKIVLEIPQVGTVENISMYSIKGKQVFQTQSRITSIDLTQYAQGIYTIAISTNGTQIVRRVIKQ